MKVNRMFWFRAVAMTVGFVGSVMAIRNLNQFKTPAAGKAVNLCPTRVKEVSIAGGFSLVQQDMAWFRKHDGRMEELDPIAVEKWFGRHCVVDADSAEAPTGAGEQLATLTFVSGPPQVLFSTSAGIFTWMNEPFTSAELKEALRSLPELPIRLRPSR